MRSSPDLMPRNASPNGERTSFEYHHITSSMMTSTM